MSLTTLRLGYVPLTDAAPLIVAQELGFAAEEGLALDLIRVQSWAQSRDLLGMGGIDAAHMLVPLPIAQTLGLGPAYPRFDLVMMLSVGGQAIAVSAALADAMRAQGHGFGFDDPIAAREALMAVAGGQLRVGVPFPFSTQAELVRRWLDGTDLAPGVAIHTVPPPLMADALAAGEVDAFCVGEPWASYAVETGVGVLLLAGRAIWASPPEKGLVVTRDFTETRPEETGRLMRAVWRACRWLDRPDNRGTAAEILSRPEYLNLPPELTERGLLGRLHVSAAGEVRQFPDFIRFHDGAANFPWRSLAALLARRIAAAHGLDVTRAMETATECFRTDLYRQHLRSAGADLPGASARIEGAMAHSTAVASEKGQMILAPDGFFDGETFDLSFANR
ncbi:MAG: CmpA/NrtA family ABC transporter substrate-binding protein [Pseudotabrizicola sp.]|uniref:CmpA/NrtA family ABC transporter substrate-binding protein n=1 Tax=Pseudotabrizicola sp. TaxID=2939647 RepID=UPI00271B8516|nr:CmpA/NrtA family ABC transporter substrate-binding protein [Pseudotabrizicola sp.]MDO8884481.1 CmpA/NrtA family ABC transporter substrate-binding protein [Pseudotabrizicola sp.]MDP2081336.1 CmpA/NrtA family ABC transporter substrate-binding protein [Pseudotabrizicola sp.]MDZ7576045.1 CmpA/NrtA family ABC transporter substrate-binding protein [Pseudotabrizicola sp.]